MRREEEEIRFSTVAGSHLRRDHCLHDSSAVAHSNGLRPKVLRLNNLVPEALFA